MSVVCWSFSNVPMMFPHNTRPRTPGAHSTPLHSRALPTATTTTSTLTWANAFFNKGAVASDADAADCRCC